jgi:hypothetical protein
MEIHILCNKYYVFLSLYHLSLLLSQALLNSATSVSLTELGLVRRPPSGTIERFTNPLEWAKIAVKLFYGYISSPYAPSFAKFKQ